MVLILAPAALPGLRAEVDLRFDFSAAQWEQNGVYEVSVVLSNTSAEPEMLAAVQVDFNYASARFKGTGETAAVLVADNLTGYDFAVELIDTATEGQVLYQKGITARGEPNYFTLSGSGELVLAVFRFRVESAAQPGPADFVFRHGVEVLKRLPNDDTVSVLGAKPDGSVEIVADATPPQTRAVPAGRLIRFGDSWEVALTQRPAPAHEDLETIFYQVGSPAAETPTLEGPALPGGGTVALPLNSEAHPGPITAELRFFGRDHHGNIETPVNLEEYTVDVIRPSILNPARTPERVKLGEDVTVTFSVNEALSGHPSVTLNGRSLVRTSGWPDYTYIYTAQEGDAEGPRPIVIAVTDLSGNQRVDGSLSVMVDYSPPAYTPVSMAPRPAKPNDTLTIVFEASEPLDTSLTAVSIDGNPASYVSRSGLRYTYSYPVIGLEESSFVLIHGYDLVGNSSYNNQGWGEIEVTGADQYGNPGEGEGTVTIIYQRYEME